MYVPSELNIIRKTRLSLIHPENRASVRVAERIGETLQGHIHHLGREMLCFGVDREGYTRRAGDALEYETFSLEKSFSDGSS